MAEIHVASWQHAYKGVLPDDYLDGLAPEQRLPMWTHLLESPQPGVHVGVEESAGKVVGFYSIAPPNEDDLSLDSHMLYTLYLHPAAIGKGIGRMLMDDAETRMRAQGATSGVLRVIEANDNARRFYERCGWVAEPGTAPMEDAWGQQVKTIRYAKSLM